MLSRGIIFFRAGFSRQFPACPGSPEAILFPVMPVYWFVSCAIRIGILAGKGPKETEFRERFGIQNPVRGGFGPGLKKGADDFTNET